MGEEIITLRKSFEFKKQRLEKLDNKYGDEHKHARENETETIRADQTLITKMNNILIELHLETNQHKNMPADHHKIAVDNEILRT